MERIIKTKDEEIESFFVRGESNPCGCGSNAYHEESDGKDVYGVCNACQRDIYLYKEYFEFDEWVWKHPKKHIENNEEYLLYLRLKEKYEE